MTTARAALCAALMLAAGACTQHPSADKTTAAKAQAAAQTPVALVQAEDKPAAPAVVVDKDFADKVHAYLLSHPEVLLEMQDAYVRRREASEANKVQAHLASLHKQIFDDPRDPSVGPKNAKVTVVEFFDYRCPHCKDAAPDVLNLIKTHPDVRFVFKEMPIFGEQSQAAAAVALAANRQGKYLPVYQALMSDHAVDTDSVTQILSQNGLNPTHTFADSADPKIQAQIGDVQRLASTLGIAGTPGFLVNNHYVAGADIPQLTRLIEQQKKS